MSEKEKSIIDEIAEKLPNLSSESKAYVKGFMEGCITSAKTEQAEKKEE